jgi:hypothetical protein
VKFYVPLQNGTVQDWIQFVIWSLRQYLFLTKKLSLILTKSGTDCGHFAWTEVNKKSQHVFCAKRAYSNWQWAFLGQKVSGRVKTEILMTFLGIKFVSVSELDHTNCFSNFKILSFH